MRLALTLVKSLDLRTGEKWDTMLPGVTDIASLPDPTVTVIYARSLHDNLYLYRVSCPIGVLLAIFEAPPEVITNVAAPRARAQIRSVVHPRILHIPLPAFPPFPSP